MDPMNRDESLGAAWVFIAAVFGIGAFCGVVGYQTALVIMQCGG